jgi:hypothetical protein
VVLAEVILVVLVDQMDLLAKVLVHIPEEQVNQIPQTQTTVQDLLLLQDCK